MNDCYSPHTGEHIRTDNPASWMGRAGTPVPDYDPQVAGAFWRGDAWEIVPAQPVVEPVPEVVSMRQAKLALLQADLLDAVDAAMQSADRAAQIEWEYAQEVRRDWPTLLVVQTALGLTDEQIDGLFVAAAPL